MKFLFISLAVFLAGCHTIKAAQSPVRQDRQNPPAVKEQPQTEASARTPAAERGALICSHSLAYEPPFGGRAGFCDPDKAVSVASYSDDRHGPNTTVCCFKR